jgi:hypothetical protein
VAQHAAAAAAATEQILDEDRWIGGSNKHCRDYACGSCCPRSRGIEIMAWLRDVEFST